MTARKMTRDRAKAALKKLKKEGRLPRNYPLAAYYKLHMLQEKGERLLAQTRLAIGEREVSDVDGLLADTSLEANLIEVTDDTVVAESVGE
jgi:DNA invertase Pin-like site-specific DNA recombinase